MLADFVASTLSSTSVDRYSNVCEPPDRLSLNGALYVCPAPPSTRYSVVATSTSSVPVRVTSDCRVIPMQVPPHADCCGANVTVVVGAVSVGSAMPAPPNSTQLRLPTVAVGPPVTARNTKYTRCEPAKSSGKVWLVYVLLFVPVDLSVTVWAIGPVWLSRRISTAARSVPTGTPAAPPAYRNVICLVMFVRLTTLLMAM